MRHACSDSKIAKTGIHYNGEAHSAQDARQRAPCALADPGYRTFVRALPEENVMPVTYPLAAARETVTRPIGRAPLRREALNRHLSANRAAAFLILNSTL